MRIAVGQSPDAGGRLAKLCRTREMGTFSFLASAPSWSVSCRARRASLAQTSISGNSKGHDPTRPPVGAGALDPTVPLPETVPALDREQDQRHDIARASAARPMFSHDLANSPARKIEIRNCPPFGNVPVLSHSVPIPPGMVRFRLGDACRVFAPSKRDRTTAGQDNRNGLRFTKGAGSSPLSPFELSRWRGGRYACA